MWFTEKQSTEVKIENSKYAFYVYFLFDSCLVTYRDNVNKFDLCAWIKWLGDSYWFCSLSAENVNLMKTSQLFIIFISILQKYTPSLGFDLTTRDSYFSILVEVFTNHILAKNTYFMNLIEWSEHKITVLEPADEYEINQQCHIFKSIIYFFYWEKIL